MKDLLIGLLIENKTPLIMGLQFLVHKALSYYVTKGKKSFKGFIKFIIGKDEPST